MGAFRAFSFIPCHTLSVPVMVATSNQQRMRSSNRQTQRNRKETLDGAQGEADCARCGQRTPVILLRGNLLPHETTRDAVLSLRTRRLLWSQTTALLVDSPGWRGKTARPPRTVGGGEGGPGSRATAQRAPVQEVGVTVTRGAAGILFPSHSIFSSSLNSRRSNRRQRNCTARKGKLSVAQLVT